MNIFPQIRTNWIHCSTLNQVRNPFTVWQHCVKFALDMAVIFGALKRV